MTARRSGAAVASAARVERGEMPGCNTVWPNAALCAPRIAFRLCCQIVLIDFEEENVACTEVSFAQDLFGPESLIKSCSAEEHLICS